MKKLFVTLVMAMVVILMSVLPASAATVSSETSNNDYQIEVINGCVVFYDAGILLPTAGEDSQGQRRIVSVTVWVPEASNEIQIVKVLDQGVVVTPIYNRSTRQYTWVNHMVGLCGTEGLEFLGSKYNPSDPIVGGGYLTLEFIATSTTTADNYN